jgi:Flp pilus assembly protein TadD
VLLGQLELSADRPEDALPWFREAARVLPNDLELNLALATALRRLRRDEEAKVYERRHQEIRRDLREMDRLTKAILTQPGDVTLRHEAGVTLMRLGQDDQAVRWFVSALQIDPTHQPTREALARCIRRLNDPRLEELWRPLLGTAAGAP